MWTEPVSLAVLAYIIMQEIAYLCQLYSAATSLSLRINHPNQGLAACYLSTVVATVSTMVLYQTLMRATTTGSWRLKKAHI